MKQEHKLYVFVGAAIALGIAVYVTMGERGKATQDRTTPTAASDLPVVKMAKEEAEKVTKFIIANKDQGEVTLEKKGDEWVITKPIEAQANQANVKSIVENLEKIEVTAVIGNDASIHDKYDLTEQKAVHVQAFKGDEKVVDMFFGKSGGRGQMARMADNPTVYATKGYSSFLWGREVKAWRHNEILKFEDGNVIAAEVENEHGKFSFTKADDKWSAKFYKRNDKGELDAKGGDIERFDESKVTGMLGALKNLKATNFAEDKDDTGVDDAVKNGGVIRITMKDEDQPKHVLHFGKAQEGSNRFLKVEGADAVYVVTSWAGDWATAKDEKFQKTEAKDGAPGEEGDDGHGHDDDAKDDDAKDDDAKDDDAKDDDAKDGAKGPKGGDTKSAGDKKGGDGKGTGGGKGKGGGGDGKGTGDGKGGGAKDAPKAPAPDGK